MRGEEGQWRRGWRLRRRWLATDLFAPPLCLHARRGGAVEEEGAVTEEVTVEDPEALTGDEGGSRHERGGRRGCSSRRGRATVVEQG
jgi:hypothetical protein